MKKMKHLKQLFFLTLLICTVALQAQPPAPATVTAAIGTPASGAAHYLNVTWATSTGATGYELEASTNGSTWTNIYTGTALTYAHNTGNVADATYYYRVRATNGTYSGYTNATQYPIRTACDAPAVPQLSAATTNSATLNLVAETPDANPATATYSIYCTTTSQYVQANGSLGATEVFQTRSAWGTTVIAGLSQNTNYCFYTKVRNSDGYVTVAQGASLTSTETFTTNANFSRAFSSPTNKYWAPESCNGDTIGYKSSGGCTGGYIGKTGAWNDFYGCFLRTPAVNCTGLTTAIVNFDLSNSYFANHPKDNVYFNMWVDGGYKPASAIRINGVRVDTVINGQRQVRFTQARNCVNVTVEYDLTTSSNLSGVLFYLNVSCGYNDSQVFSVGFDNITIQSQSAPTACITTTACTAASIASATGNMAVCAGNNTNFTVTTNGSVASYQWQVSTNGGSTWSNATGAPYSNGNTAQLTITGVTSGMSGYRYRVNVTGTCSGTPTSTPAILTVNTLPAAPGNITGLASVCQNQNGVAYNVATVSGATSYIWSLPSGASIATGTGTNSVTVNYGAASAGNIIVTAVNGCGNGAASAPLAITVNTLAATPGSITGSTSFCQGTVQTYSVASVSGATSYTWTLPNGWLGSSTSTVINATPNSNGGTVTVVANNACGNSAAASLTVTTAGGPAQPGAISGNANVCEGETLTYNVAEVSGATGYVWTLPNGWSGSSTTNTISVVSSVAGGNIQVAAQSNCGTSAAQTLAVTIKAKPSLPTIAGSGSVCGGTSAAYTFASGGTATGYDLILPTGWNSTAGTLGSANVTFNNQSGILKVIAANECGISDTANLTITVLPAPVVEFTAPFSPVCSTAAPIELSATPAGGTFGGTAVGGGFFNPALAPIGDNIITYSVSNANCTTTDTVVVVTTICNGINDIENTVQVYPNPFNSVLNIVLSDLSVKEAVLVDVMGRQVAASTLAAKTNTIQVAYGTAAGIYYLQLMDKNSKIVGVKKLILSK